MYIFFHCPKFAKLSYSMVKRCGYYLSVFPASSFHGWGLLMCFCFTFIVHYFHSSLTLSLCIHFRLAANIFFWRSLIFTAIFSEQHYLPLSVKISVYEVWKRTCITFTNMKTLYVHWDLICYYKNKYLVCIPFKIKFRVSLIETR